MTGSGHLLVGSIGVSDYDTVTYELGGKTVKTKVSPVALVEIINNTTTNFDFEIDEVVIFRTVEAGEANDSLLKNAFNDADVEYDFVDINLVEREEDINNILQTVSNHLRRKDQESVVLDISHSFRSVPMVFLLSLMYIETLEENFTLEKIYYSRWAGSRDQDRAPVIDLTYFRTLLKWQDASWLAQRTGTFRGIEKLMDAKREDLFAGHDSIQPSQREFADFHDEFSSAQEAIDIGFPLEAGIEAKNAHASLSTLDEDAFIGPEGMVLDPLKIALDDFSTTSQEISDKEEYQLTVEELQREAEIVDFYRDVGEYRIALEIGRELFINRLLYDAGQTDDWLCESVRKDIKPTSEVDNENTTHVNSDVDKLWNQISGARNKFAHAGFKTDNRPSDKKIEKWLTTLCQRIADDTFWKHPSDDDE